MKINTTILTLAISGLMLFTGNVYAQEYSNTSTEELNRMDSVADREKEQARIQQRKDSETIADFRYDKKQTKAKAKEARRIEAEANDAARESKLAYRNEKKAQKLRKQADKQADKASQARDKSNRN
jgi:hypothetical protein